MLSEETQEAPSDQSGQGRFHLSRRTLLLGLGGLVVGGGIGATVLARQLLTRSPLLVYRGHTGVVTSLVWSPDGKYLASGSADGTVQVWDAVTGERLSLHRVDDYALREVAWPSDGLRIVFTSDDSVRVLEVASGRLYTISVHAGADCFALSPNSARLASSSVAGIQVWSLATGDQLIKIPQQAFDLAWSPGGPRLAAAGSFSKGSVQVWDALTGQSLLTYHGHVIEKYGTITEVTWSPDGKWLASGGFEGTSTNEVIPMIRVWDAATSHTLVSYRSPGTDALVNAIVWSPNTKEIASCGTTAQVWDAATGNIGNSYDGNGYVSGNRPAFFTSLAWSPDGERLALGSENTTVEVWLVG